MFYFQGFNRNHKMALNLDCYTLGHAPYVTDAVEKLHLFFNHFFYIKVCQKPLHVTPVLTREHSISFH